MSQLAVPTASQIPFKLGLPGVGRAAPAPRWPCVAAGVCDAAGERKTPTPAVSNSHAGNRETFIPRLLHADAGGIISRAMPPIQETDERTSTARASPHF